jgi:hypothetical protein
MRTGRWPQPHPVTVTHRRLAPSLVGVPAHGRTPGADLRPGDVITGRVEILEARTDKPITKLRTTVVRDDGTVVLQGTAVCYTMMITAGHSHDNRATPVQLAANGGR